MTRIESTHLRPRIFVERKSAWSPIPGLIDLTTSKGCIFKTSFLLLISAENLAK